MSTTEVTYSAEETLDRMEEIIRRNKLKRGAYAQLCGPLEPDAPCGGVQCCMIGAAWLAHGIEFEYDGGPKGPQYAMIVSLPGVIIEAREEFVAARPELKRALDALNMAATERIVALEEETGGPLGLYYSQDAVERLFESQHIANLLWEDGGRERVNEIMLSVVGRARELVTEAS